MTAADFILIFGGIFASIFLLVVAAVWEHEDKARRKKTRDRMDDFLESINADTLEPDCF